MVIQFNEQDVTVNLFGADQRLIPPLLAALRANKFTLHNLQTGVSMIDLFIAEAILYAGDGNKARIPIFS
ncbi:hypothetical protein [Paenibacillus aestuarii]|uniref:Uncharacterized protein n=1 Tax=Paenibacillus aestuarii TaxID=516965 RepID=A0ABW0K528_9BACL|nr:hypothetical protein [Paenibacillus aestuarii]